VQIICKDGTTVQCRDFEATDSGVLFYQQQPGTGGEEEDEQATEKASGFVPITELRFVLPDELVKQPTAQRSPAQQQSMPGQAPPGAPRQQAGGRSQQQQIQQQPPGSPQQSGR